MVYVESWASALMNIDTTAHAQTQTFSAWLTNGCLTNQEARHSKGRVCAVVSEHVVVMWQQN
jgi:hypothetical protein